MKAATAPAWETEPESQLLRVLIHFGETSPWGVFA